LSQTDQVRAKVVGVTGGTDPEKFDNEDRYELSKRCSSFYWQCVQIGKALHNMDVVVRYTITGELIQQLGRFGGTLDRMVG